MIITLTLTKGVHQDASSGLVRAPIPTALAVIPSLYLAAYLMLGTLARSGLMDLYPPSPGGSSLTSTLGSWATGPPPVRVAITVTFGLKFGVNYA